MEFIPDYRNFLDAVNNIRPSRLPIYEHLICPSIMEKIMGNSFADLYNGNDADMEEFIRQYCRFFKEMTYDTVSYEVCVCGILPGSGAIFGGMAGPIQSRDDFNKYPWGQLPDMFWKQAGPSLDALRKHMPEGMKAVGGVGNGAFEISEDLVGLEHLAYMQIDDPELFADLYIKIGDLMIEIWAEFLKRYSDIFTVCRFGDDLGHKTSTLTSPNVIFNHIIPQYKRVVKLIHDNSKPFLYHSCGKIFDVFDTIIEDVGIDAKHSNEDGIAPFDEWISRYSDKIGLLGGIDVDILCTNSKDEILDKVFEMGSRFRKTANGYALGSGNSIPDYVPVEGYLAMIEAAKKIREKEA